MTETKTKSHIIWWGLALAVLVVLFFPNRKDILLDLPPLEIPTEPLQTHYLGAMALDLPSSFQFKSLEAIFYNIDPSDPTATITVSEHPRSNPYLTIQSPGLKARELEAVDFSDKFGRPAALKAFYNTRPNSWGVPKTLSDGPGEIADPVDLEIILKTQEPWGHLEFRYLRRLNRSEAELTGGWWRIGQTALVEWAQKISERYQWLGSNEAFVGPSLALQFGQLVPPTEGAEWEMDFKATFRGPTDEHYLVFDTPTFQITLEGFNDRPEMMTAEANRIVGDHPGREQREWWAGVRNNYRRLFGRPNISSLNLTWNDGSGSKPSLREPIWQISLSNTSFRRPDAQKTARLLGVWEVALNSIRLSSPVAEVGQTDGLQAK